ncbi:MAG: 4'-phosphopantetheinyl transferase superfamily protein [Clostridia bacterium]|nr:4'-phosphopantetheinyl transferase superfamily protein [Clostridia bacterium]
MDIQTYKKTAGKTCLFVYLKNDTPTDELITSSVKSYLGNDVSVTIKRQPKGKPYVSAPIGVYVSVTHSGDYCLIALSDREIGVDLQIHERLRGETDVDSAERYLKLSKRFFHPKEHSYVEKNVKPNFFEVWCAKESYVKFTGEGIDDNFWTYSIIPDNITKLPKAWEKKNVYFEMVDFKKGYTLCLCSEKPTKIKMICCDEVQNGTMA